MTYMMQSDEGILLEVRKAGEGGRKVRLFSRQSGALTGFISRAVLSRWGTGVLFPYAHIRYSAVRRGDMTVLTQYEGRRSMDFLSMEYGDITRWYYAAEIVLRFFPEGEADGTAYALLSAAARCGMSRNPAVTAMILSVQLLAAAGFDPAEEEPMEALRCGGEARPLVTALRRYRWEGPLGAAVRKRAFEEAARYLDAFIARCGVEMKTAGAFLMP